MRSDRFISSRTIRSMRSRATSGHDSSESAPLGDGTRTLWRPLRTPLFRNLLIADAMSDVGTFMQTVEAAWLMVSLGSGAMYVALTQNAYALPFFVFALPAGSDRRHRRSASTDSIHGDLDGRRGGRARRDDDRRPHVAMAPARADVRAVGGRRV